MATSPPIVKVHDPCRYRPDECYRLHHNAALLAGAKLPVARSAAAGLFDVPAAEIQQMFVEAVGRYSGNPT